MRKITKKYRSAEDFFRNATSEERQAVFKKVIDGAVEMQLETMRKADEILAKRKAKSAAAGE